MKQVNGLRMDLKERFIAGYGIKFSNPCFHIEQNELNLLAVSSERGGWHCLVIFVPGAKALQHRQECYFDFWSHCHTCRKLPSPQMKLARLQPLHGFGFIIIIFSMV